MVLYKYGESISFSLDDIKSAEIVVADKEIHDRFVKLASSIKKIAPKAEDFLYFSAIMMHAAERALIDENGNLLKNANGSDIEAHWDINEKTGSWKWVCSDKNVRPYRNSNTDIFPESELKIAYKKWIGKPLCKDHQSSSVDGIRGIILDTYWDDKFKRIIALCALDKVNYADLARKVETGYANDVSMGVGVGRSICFDCGNTAKTENDYCNCVKTRRTYGEINTELNPIELSIVVNGADKKAKILDVFAAAQQFENIIKTSKSENIPNFQEQFEKLSIRVADLENEILISKSDNNTTLRKAANLSDEGSSEISLLTIKNKMSSIEDMIKIIATKISTEDSMKTKTAYWQGTEEPTPGKPQYQKEEADKIRELDSHMKTPLTDLGPVDGLPKQDLETKKLHARATIDERRALRTAAVEKAKQAIKVAYPQGTEEKTTYQVDPGAKVRDTEFEVNKGPVGAKDADVKEKLCRGGLKAKFVKSSNGKAGDNKWEVVSGDKVVFAASLDELTGSKPVLYSSVATKEFAQQMMKNIRSLGADKAASMYKAAQETTLPPVEETPAPAEAPVDATVPEAMPATPETEEKSQEFQVDLDAVKSGLTEVDDLIQTVLEKMEPGQEALKEEGESFTPEQTATAKSNPELVVEAALADLTRDQPKQATASLSNLKVVLNAGLNKSFKKNIKNLKASQEEVKLLITAVNSNASNPQFLLGLANQAITDATKAVKKAKLLQMAFVKYAKGSDQLEKRAEMEIEMKKSAQVMPTVGAKPATPAKPAVVNPADTKADPQKGQADVTFPEETITAKKDVSTATEEYDLTTVAGRKEYREKLAATVASKMKLSEMLDKAHPKGSTTLSGLAGTKEAVFEDLTGVQSKMMESLSHEPKTKQAAQYLDKLVKSGKVNTDDLPEMVAHGLDKVVVDYWKKYYSQAEGGSEFAAGLVKEYAGAKKESKKAEDEEIYKAKLVKSYDLAYEMADAGLIGKDRDSIRKQAEEVVKYDDAAYQSMQRVVAHHARVSKKTSTSSAVQVGVALDCQASDESGSSLYDELVSVLSDGKSFKF